MDRKLEIVYKILIDGLELTDKTLESYGLTKDDINNLINNKNIQSTKTGIYRLVNINKFRQYGLKLLLEERKRERANLCFKRCYEMASNAHDICLQMLDASIRARDFEYAFKVFENLDKARPEEKTVSINHNVANNNLYLHLLSFITKCPDKYIDRIKQMQSRDYMLPNSRCNNLENKVRYSIQCENFTYAYNRINEYVARKNEYSIRFELIRILLYKTIDRQKQLKRDLLRLAKDKQYKIIVSILEDIDKYRNLTKYEMRVLKIASEVLNVLNGKDLSVPISSEATTIDEALANNNFALALEINTSFLNKNNIPSNEDTINILLLALKELTPELNKVSYKFVYSPDLSSTVPNDTNKDIKEVEDYVEYILNKGISLTEAIKKHGILSIETILLIKLVYVRKCFESGEELKINEAKFVLEEVEAYENKTEKVINFLAEVKNYRTKPHQKTLKPTNE